ncbi:MAG: multicopper oxidase domain-containing protein [Candidatus Caldarchaeum sp.]
MKPVHVLFVIAVLMALTSASAFEYAPGVPGNPPPNAKPDKTFVLVADEADVVIDEGIVFRAFVFNGTSPGPLILVQEGDVVEIIVRNQGKYTHGLSIHAANTQTSKFVGNIAPGSEGRLVFKADFPGVYMYHCAPGGHGILTHTLAGMYGMVVVEPKRGSYLLERQLGREPDIKVYLVQHEVYLNGRDFFDGKAAYVMFNGKVFRYVGEPIQARPGDYVRFYFLNVGPSLTSSFHAVGGIWEYSYQGGNPSNVAVGLQTVTVGPTDSYVIEWRVPAEGNFLIVSHAFGTQAIKGAVGLIASSVNATRTPTVLPQGPSNQPVGKVKRVVAPFEPTSQDEPRTFLPGERAVIQMVGNSFYPKISRVPVGSTVVWVNEDVLSIGSGEITGQHNVAVVQGPVSFASQLLKNAEQFSFKIEKEGEYQYICGIHPYMKGVIVAYQAAGLSAGGGGIGFTVDLTSLVVFIGGLGALSLLIFVGERSSKKNER